MNLAMNLTTHAVSPRTWVYTNERHTEIDWVYPGNQIRVHRMPSSPDPDYVNHYDATVLDVVADGPDCATLVLSEHKVYNQDEKFAGVERLSLKQHGIRYIEIRGYARKTRPAPLQTMRQLMASKR